MSKNRSIDITVSVNVVRNNVHKYMNPTNSQDAIFSLKLPPNTHSPAAALIIKDGK